MTTNDTEQRVDEGTAGTPRLGRRERIKSKRGLSEGYRLLIFTLGLLFIFVGLVLSVLPGPLTIPPILLGLWIWSTEFAWAKRFFEAMKRKGDAAWEHAKRKPKSSAAITLAGLVAAGFVIYAIVHFEVIGRAKDAVGL